MHHDAQLIAQSILELKQNSDTVKDYLFPVLMSFFSALLGGLCAYYFNQRQERNKNEKENFSVATKIFTSALTALNQLIGIKANYCNLHSTDPIMRALSFPAMILGEDKFSVDLSSMSFIKNIPTANKSIYVRWNEYIKHNILKRKRNHPSDEEMSKSWRNYNRLGACVNNYNYIMDLLKTRSMLDIEIKEKLTDKHTELCQEYPMGGMSLPINVILETIDYNSLAKYIDLTEKIICLTDNVLKELDSFVVEFPKIAESNIELSKVGRGVKIIAVKNKRPMYLTCMKPVVPPDFTIISQITGMSIEEARNRYTFSDWY